MSNLRFLVLRTRFARGHDCDPLPWLSHALANVTSDDCSVLEALTISIDFHGVWRFSISSRDMRDMHEYTFWRDLDAALTRPGVFTHLSVVEVALNITDSLDVLFKLLADQMPALVNAGILRIVYADSGTFSPISVSPSFH